MSTVRGTSDPSKDTQAAPENQAVTFAQLLEVVKLMNQNAPTKESALTLELLQGMKADVARAVPKSNLVPLNVGVFNIKPGCIYCDNRRRHEETGEFGHPKEPLRYESYQSNVRMRDSQLTVMEVELLNLLGDKCASSGMIESIGSIDKPHSPWTAKIDRKGTTPRLMIEFPASDLIQALGDIPPLTAIILELLHGQLAVDPLNMFEEVKRLRAQVDSLLKEQGKGAAA